MQPSDYKELVDIKKHKRKAIFHSELFFFWNIAKELGVKRIVESGTYHGVTANRLEKLFSECDIWTYEYKDKNFQKAVKKCHPRVNVVFGSMDKSKLNKNTAVIIDGPKGEKAIELAEEIVGKVALVAIHDMDRYIPVLVERFVDVVHSGKPDKAVKKLDKHIPLNSTNKYTKYYGRVLACIGGGNVIEKIM